MMENMRDGQVVPRLTHEECMDLMWQILSDADLHKRGSEGYRQVGQSIDLHGQEDNQVVREAGTYWNEETSGGYANVRQNIDAEMVTVVE